MMFRKLDGARSRGRRVVSLLATCGFGLTAASAPAMGADGQWSNLLGGLWSVPGNWLGGTIADGADATANFSALNITANATVNLDSARSIGILRFADATTQSNDWILANNATPANILTLSTTSGTPSIFVNNRVATISAGLAGTQGFTKYNAGQLILSGANTLSGTVRLLQGNTQLTGATGDLAADVTFGNTALFVYSNSTATGTIADTVGAINFAVGDGTVNQFRSVAFNSDFTIASYARAAGATGNFLVSGTGATAVTNKIIVSAAVPTGVFLDQGLFFTSTNYAAYDTAGYMRALAYGSDPNTTSVAADVAIPAPASDTHIDLTGAITAQTTETIRSLRLGTVNGLTLDTGATLTVSAGGILKAGGNAATITGGTGITTGGSNEMVIRTDASTDTLTIATPILSTSTGGVTKSGLGTLTLSASNAFAGGLVVNQGTVNLSTSNTFTGGVTVNGGTLIMSGANTYSGPTNITSATVRVANSGALGSTSGVTLTSITTGSNGGVLELAGVAVAGPVPLTMNTNAANGFRATLSSVSGVSTWAGPITLTGGGLVQITGAAGATLNVTGNIGGGSFNGILFVRGNGATGTISSTINIPNGSVNKTDTGTWTIASTGNTWTTTTVSVGTLKIGATNAFPVTTILTMGQGDTNSSTLDLNGFDQTVSGLLMSSTGGTKTITNTITATLKTLTVNNAAASSLGTSTLAGILAGALNLSKSGAGTLTLGSSNTYTGGTTISAGVLAIASAQRLPNTTPVTLAGGTLSTGGFAETVGTLELTADSTINMGAGTSVLTFANSSTVAWAPNTLTISNWSGDPLAGGGTDRVFFGADSTGLTPEQLALITFTGFSPGATILPTGEVIPVPEPTTGLVMALAGAGLLARRSRRR